MLPRRVKWSDVGMDFQTGDNAIRPRDGATYVKPAVQEDSQKIAQGFALRAKIGGKTETRPLDVTGWPEVSFTGQYPIGTVEYEDPRFPVAVKLEAFSPFIPHNADDSGLPATVFHFTVTNRGKQKVDRGRCGWLQNATSFYSGKAGRRRAHQHGEARQKRHARGDGFQKAARCDNRGTGPTFSWKTSKRATARGKSRAQPLDPNRRVAR